MCQRQERNEFLWRPGEEFKLWETEILKQFAKKKLNLKMTKLLDSMTNVVRAEVGGGKMK